MKIKEKEEARKLRNEGYSLNEIHKQLGVSKSTVSLWVKDIRLSSEQRKKLDSNNFGGRGHGGKMWSQLNLDQRIKYQQQGATSISNFDLHLAGCMLYWAEGSKDRNSMSFTNMDPEMVILFLRFLKECYSIDEEKVDIYLNSHYLSSKTETEIKEYWQSLLKLPDKCFKYFFVEKRIPKKPKTDYGFGICQIRIHDTEIVQNIFGAIKAYVGISSNRWL